MTNIQRSISGAAPGGGSTPRVSRLLFGVLAACLVVLNLINRPAAVSSPFVGSQQDDRITSGIDEARKLHGVHDGGGDDDNDDDDTPIKGCDAVLQRIHDMNDCWRRHIQSSLLQAHQENTSDNSLDEDFWLHREIRCPALSTSSKETATIGAPLYQFAYYRGQGFGRVVAHSVEACLMAFVLGRPCLVHLAPRDPYYTWRSFVESYTYHWDPALLHSIPSYANQLEGLLQQLSELAANDWGTNTTVKMDEPSLVFPMHRKFGKSSWNKALDYYSTSNRTNQVLVSPNWATAWFTRIPLARIFQVRYQCAYDEIITMQQNAMYGPTDLTWRIHQERYNKALASGKWVNATADTGNDATTTKTAQKTKRSRVLPHKQLVATSTTPHHTKDDANNYGTIHLRVHFLDERHPGNIPKGEIVTMVRYCLEKAQQLYQPSNHNEKPFPQNWWLLADNIDMAHRVTKGIQLRQEETKRMQKQNLTNTNPFYSTSIPSVHLFHDYDDNAPQQHSVSGAATGLYGHANMAGSIQDWMAMHQSQISIVVHEGAFGSTAARGNGKQPQHYCGSREGSKTNKKRDNSFRIYF
jgi:hypothetical protein